MSTAKNETPEQRERRLARRRVDQSRYRSTLKGMWTEEKSHLALNARRRGQ